MSNINLIPALFIAKTRRKINDRPTNFRETLVPKDLILPNIFKSKKYKIPTPPTTPSHSLQRKKYRHWHRVIRRIESKNEYDNFLDRLRKKKSRSIEVRLKFQKIISKVIQQNFKKKIEERLKLYYNQNTKINQNIRLYNEKNLLKQTKQVFGLSKIINAETDGKKLSTKLKSFASLQKPI